MVKCLVIIMSLGFTLQATGVAYWLQRDAVQAVHFCNDENNEVEKGAAHCKKSVDKIHHYNLLDPQALILYSRLENKVTGYPSGVLTKPFLPPR